MSKWFQSTSIDRPRSDLALIDGVLLDTTDLREGLPTLFVHVGGNSNTLDRGVVKTVEIGRTEKRETGRVRVKERRK